MSHIAVLGAGSWGTALSIVLADKRYNVRLWTRRSDQQTEINTSRTNRRYLPHAQLPQRITAATSLQYVVEDTSYILLVLPTAAIRSVMQQLKPYVNETQIII